MSNYFQTGEFFPPVDHEKRLNRYKINELFYKGQHEKLLKNHNGFYISANLAGLIVKKSADYLEGDGFTASAQKSDNSKEQLALERIHEDNDMNTLLYELAIEAAYKGDAFIKIGYGQNYKGLYPSTIDPYRVRIESIDANNVFPETMEDDKKKIIAYHHAKIVESKNYSDAPEDKKFLLKVETHIPGFLIYKEFYLKPIVTRYDDDYKPIIESGKIGEQIGETKVQKTGVKHPLVVHIPNLSSPSSWEGQDDLSDLKPLFSELNNRLTQVANILDKHSDPALLVPAGILEEDGTGRPTFRVATSKVIEMEKDDYEAKYLTWNGQLQNAYSEIDRIENYILMTSEIPKVALGLDNSGTSGSSGKAIRMRLNNLLTKIKRKRGYVDKALRRVFVIAQELEHSLGIADYEITVPKLNFTDGIPRDLAEDVSLALMQNGGLPIKSQKRTIMETYGLSEQQAENEIERIRMEQEFDVKTTKFADPNVFNETEVSGKFSMLNSEDVAEQLGFKMENEDEYNEETSNE